MTADQGSEAVASKSATSPLNLSTVEGTIPAGSGGRHNDADGGCQAPIDLTTALSNVNLHDDPAVSAVTQSSTTTKPELVHHHSNMSRIDSAVCLPFDAEHSESSVKINPVTQQPYHYTRARYALMTAEQEEEYQRIEREGWEGNPPPPPPGAVGPPFYMPPQRFRIFEFEESGEAVGQFHTMGWDDDELNINGEWGPTELSPTLDLTSGSTMPLRTRPGHGTRHGAFGSRERGLRTGMRRQNRVDVDSYSGRLRLVVPSMTEDGSDSDSSDFQLMLEYEYGPVIGDEDLELGRFSSPARYPSSWLDMALFDFEQFRVRDDAVGWGNANVNNNTTLTDSEGELNDDTQSEGSVEIVESEEQSATEDWSPAPSSTIDGEPLNWEPYQKYIVWACRGNVFQIRDYVQTVFSFEPPISLNFVGAQLNGNAAAEHLQFLEQYLPGEAASIHRARARVAMQAAGHVDRDVYEGRQSGVPEDLDETSPFYEQPPHADGAPDGWNRTNDVQLNSLIGCSPGAFFSAYRNIAGLNPVDETVQWIAIRGAQTLHLGISMGEVAQALAEREAAWEDEHGT